MRKTGPIVTAASQGARRKPRAAWRSGAWASCALLALMPCAAQQSWLFEAALDGKPIGEHRLVLDRSDDGAETLRSEARFDVRLLGVPLYRSCA